jgi:FkbM family methyltransferase
MCVPTAARVFSRLPRFFRRHRLICGWMRLTGEDPIQLVHIIEGVEGYADLREGTLRLLVIDGDFEREFFELARLLLPRNGVFFDVGANFGLMSLGVAGAIAPGGSLHVFEPNPFLIPVLKRSFDRLSFERFYLNGCAVSECSGTVTMQFNPRHTGASFVTAYGGVTVPSIRLDDYIQEKQISRVDLLKLDVEGFELPALRGMQRSLASGVVRTLYFEFNPEWLARNCRPEELLQFLADCGFTLFFCRKHDFERLGRMPQRVRAVSTYLPLLPLPAGEVPEDTDLLAVHRMVMPD